MKHLTHECMLYDSTKTEWAHENSSLSRDFEEEWPEDFVDRRSSIADRWDRTRDPAFQV